MSDICITVHTCYVANDGKEFSSEKACEDYEKSLSTVSEDRIIYVVMRELATSPSSYFHEYQPIQKYIAKIFSSEQQAHKFIADNISKQYKYTCEQYTIEKED